MTQPTETTAVNGKETSAVRRGMNQIADMFYQPFSSKALSSLPQRGQGARAKSKRADRIPDDPSMPNYQSTDNPEIRVRIPKKVATPVKVEAKVWFANERTFISYLSMGLLLSTIASGLLFGARDSPARYFALVYAAISAGVLIYGWAIFQKRLTMISSRYSGSFDLLAGPLVICVALFVAILANFLFRLEESKTHLNANPMSFRYAWDYAGSKSQV